MNVAVGLKFGHKTWRDVDLTGKTVLLRTDYNVPIENGKIGESYRLLASLPTLRTLIAKKCKICIISHLGRPEGKVVLKFSLEKVAEKLSELLGQEVKFVPDCIGDKVRVAVKKMSVGEIILLENLRFYSDEEQDDDDFARQLVKSSGADIFIQDAFGVIHRQHASTSAIVEYIPSVAGPLLVKEWEEIQNVMQNPNRPLVAVVGGAKISDKLPMIKKIIEVADKTIIGGAIANNFLMNEGFLVGASLWDTEVNDEVNKIFVQVKKKFGKTWRQNFILPVDLAISKNGNPDGARYIVPRGGIKPNNAVYDIGTKTINRISETIKTAGTVIWNGTLGMAEKPNYAHASSRLALTLANNPQIFSLVCGGDTVDFARDWDSLNGGSFSYISTGGGAALALIAGEKLPGIDNLL